MHAMLRSGHPLPILSTSSPSAVAFSTAINSNPAQTSTGGPSQTSRPNQPESVSHRPCCDDHLNSPRVIRAQAELLDCAAKHERQPRRLSNQPPERALGTCTRGVNQDAE